MKIQQVLLSPRLGGAESLAEALSAAWRDKGIENEIAFVDQNDEIRRSRWSRVRRVREAVRAFDPDVIVAHTALPNVYARIGSSKRIPKVIVLHSSARDYERRALRVAERVLRARTQHVVGVGRQQIDEYSRHFGTSIPFSVIPNGVRNNLPLAPSINRDRSSVVTLARIDKVKNPKLWAQVAERLRTTEEMNLVWWGPAAGDEMEQFVRDHQSSSRAGHFAGPTQDPGAVLSQACILFHPSDRESHGLSLIEAACVGLPIVCSDVVASVLPSELCVEQFQAGNAEHAAETLRRVMREYELYAEASMRQAYLVREMFGIEECARRYLEACKAAMARKP